MDGLDPTEGAHEQGKVDEKVVEILGGCLEETRQRIEQVRHIARKPDGELDEHEWGDAVAALMGRWRQMEDMLEKGYQLVQSSIQRK